MTKEKISKGSLLQIPLLRHILNDPDFKIVKRGIDNSWFYNSHIPISVTGFNPLLQSSFIAQRSYVSEWLRSYETPTRRMEGLMIDYIRKKLYQTA